MLILNNQSLKSRFADGSNRPLNPDEEFNGKPVLEMKSAILNRTLPNGPCLYEMEESLIEGVLEKYCVQVEGRIIVYI